MLYTGPDNLSQRDLCHCSAGRLSIGSAFLVCSLLLACDLGGGGGIEGRICDPAAPDCPAGLRCAPVLVDEDGGAATEPGGEVLAGGRIAWACLSPVGGMTVGGECDAREACEVDLLCVADGKSTACRRPCDPHPLEDTHLEGLCGEGERCTELVEVTGIGACLPRPTTCSSDADCGAELICAPRPTRDETFPLTLQCTAPEGASATLDSCTAHHQCQSGVCLRAAGTGGRCYGACDDDGDCPQGSACELVILTVETGSSGEGDGGEGGGETDIQLPGCVHILPTCTTDADCPAGLLCLPHRDPLDDLALILMCAESQGGPGSTGDACSSGDECLSGICLLDSNGDPYQCYGACVNDEDCPEGQRCSEVVFDLDQGTRAAVPGCIPDE